MKLLPVLLVPVFLLLPSCDSAPGPSPDAAEAIQGHWNETWMEKDFSVAVVCEIQLYVDSLRLSAPMACDPDTDVCTFEVPAAKLPWAGTGFLKLGGRFVRGD